MTGPLPPAALARLGTGSNPFLCLAFTPDGKRLASGGYDKALRVWDSVSGKEIFQWDAPEGNFAAVLFSPDGSLLASGGLRDPVVHLWDAATGREVHALEGLPRGASSLAFAPNGKTLAAGGYHTDEIYQWDVATGKPLGPLSGPDVPVPEVQHLDRPPPDFSYVAFAPDGKTFASGHLLGLVRVWDAATRRELRHFRGPVDDVFTHLTFSGDGRLLASWGEAIRLRRTGDWKLLPEFGAQPALRISSLAFSPDGRMLASGSSGRDVGDDTVHLWEVATGQERARLVGHQYAVASVAFAPDGHTLVSGSLDGTALVWDLRKLPQGAASKNDLSRDELEALWRDLGASDAAVAYQAVHALAHAPARSVPLLRERLRPMVRAQPRRIAELLTALDSRRFKERQEATDDLTVQAELVEADLRWAQKYHASPEVRRRVEQILLARESVLFSGRPLRQWRALEILETIGTPDARQLLTGLAAGNPSFRLTQEARAALDRLAKRSAERP